MDTQKFDEDKRKSAEQQAIDEIRNLQIDNHKLRMTIPFLKVAHEGALPETKEKEE